MAIYVGAGGVKTPTAIYVGAGGVKTVSAVYVGVGSVKQVWPDYTVGDQLLEFTTDNYLAYTRSVTWTQSGDSSYSPTVNSWSSTSYSVRSISSGYYLDLGFNGLQKDQGAYISTAKTINASAISYLGLEIQIYDSHSSSASAPGFDVYASIGSSASAFCSSDSGYATYSYVTRNRSQVYASTSNSMYHFLINLTGCTTTGYFKTGIVLSRNRTTDRDDSGRLYVCNILVGNSTSISNYNFYYSSSSWTSTFTVT